jgi:type IV pilus assembly protein PilM
MSKVIVIDWTPQHLCLLEGSDTGSRVTVRKLTTLALPSGPGADKPDGTLPQLRAMLAGYADSDARVLLLVSRSQAVLRNLRVPDVSDAELPAIVQFQAMRELSIPVEQASIDYEPLALRDADGARQVVLAALQRDWVDQCQEAVRSEGLELHRIGLRPFATWRTFRQAAAVPEDEAVLLVDLIGEYAELTIGCGDAVLLSHAFFPRGAAGGDGPVCGFASAMVNEVRRTLVAFGQQAPAASVRQIAVLAGDTEHVGLVGALTIHSEIPVQRFDPLAVVEWSSEFGEERQRLSDARGVCAAALGGALSANERWPIDFLNPKRPAPRRSRRGPIAVLAGVAAVLVLACSYWLGSQQLAKVNGQIKSLTEQHKKLEESLAEADEVSSQYGALDAWTRSDTNCLEELRRLSSDLIDTRHIFVNTLKMDRETNADGSWRLLLEGAARNELRIGELHTKLNDSGHYSAQPAGTVQSDARGGDYHTAFKSSVAVKSTARADESKTGRPAESGRRRRRTVPSEPTGPPR